MITTTTIETIKYLTYYPILSHITVNMGTEIIVFLSFVTIMMARSIFTPDNRVHPR